MKQSKRLFLISFACIPNHVLSPPVNITRIRKKFPKDMGRFNQQNTNGNRCVYILEGAFVLCIAGPKGSYYEEQEHKFKINTDRNFPLNPPTITCITPIYHLNICSISGTVYCNGLCLWDKHWRKHNNLVIYLFEMLEGLLKNAQPCTSCAFEEGRLEYLLSFPFPPKKYKDKARNWPSMQKKTTEETKYKILLLKSKDSENYEASTRKEEDISEAERGKKNENMVNPIILNNAYLPNLLENINCDVCNKMQVEKTYFPLFFEQIACISCGRNLPKKIICYIHKCGKHVCLNCVSDQITPKVIQSLQEIWNLPKELSQIITDFAGIQSWPCKVTDYKIFREGTPPIQSSLDTTHEANDLAIDTVTTHFNKSISDLSLSTTHDNHVSEIARQTSTKKDIPSQTIAITPANHQNDASKGPISINAQTEAIANEENSLQQNIAEEPTYQNGYYFNQALLIIDGLILGLLQNK